MPLSKYLLYCHATVSVRLLVGYHRLEQIVPHMNVQQSHPFRSHLNPNQSFFGSTCVRIRVVFGITGWEFCVTVIGTISSVVSCCSMREIKSTCYQRSCTSRYMKIVLLMVDLNLSCCEGLNSFPSFQLMSGRVLRSASLF